MNMMKKNMIYHLTLIVFFVFLIIFGSDSILSAKQFSKENYSFTGNDLIINNITQFNTEMDNIIPSQLNGNDIKTTIQNTIELNILNHSELNSDIEAKVKIAGKLNYILLNNTTAGPIDINLEVEINKGELKKSQVSNVYAFTNGYKIDFLITNIEVTSGGNAASYDLKNKLKEYIELNLSFQRETITRIDYNTVPLNIQGCEDTRTDELVISWQSIPDAEEYEVEYTFVDDYSGTSVPLSNNQIQFDFRDNSTRIRLKDNYYRLPLLCERGYLLYRVRAIGRGGTNLQQPVFCKWSGPESGTVINFPPACIYYHSVSHMKDKMNWQVATTFAEDGKRSDIITYMDGTFRQRQSVTGINLEWDACSSVNGYTESIFNINMVLQCLAPGSYKIRQIVAGETIYDYQGRAAVSILPVPTNSQRLEYLPDINRSSATNVQYSWKDFDKAGYNCPDTKSLSSALNSNNFMGASAYYSKTNPNKLGFNAFIPDADEYPFTQISYLQDNTGRIAAQTGVGNTFQFGNEKHYTRFFYSAPNQEELDMMFGTEAGDSKRYQKNAVIDANGQVAVTYVNPEGKNIATALAGVAPDSVIALENQNPVQINVSLMNNNVINTDEKTLITEHSFLVTSDNTLYTFNYSIIPESLKDAKCDGTPVCLDCIYNFDISLYHIESCTNVYKFKFSGTIGDLMNGGSKPDIINCNNQNIGNFIKDTSLKLDIGTYNITKKVTVNKQAGIDYVEQLAADYCPGKLDSLIKDELSKIDTNDCYKNCLNCDEPPVPTATCDTAYCDPAPNRCDIIRNMIKDDISPGGQYGQLKRKSDGTIDASAYPLSIFNPANFLPQAHPGDLFPLLTGNNFNYDYNALVNNWSQEIAEKLLPLHPEYCMLGWCSEPGIDASLDYDLKLLSAKNYDAAKDKGFVVTGMTDVYMQLLNNDPWYIVGPNQPYQTMLLQKLKNMDCDPNVDVPADILAMRAAYCAYHNPLQQMQQNQMGSTIFGNLPQINTPPPDCNLPQNYPNGPGFGTDIALKDLEWTFLRSFYLSAKNEIMKQNMLHYASQHGCYTGCIGKNLFYINWLNTITSYKPCNDMFDIYLYREKENRFMPGTSRIFEELAENNININLTGLPDDPCQIAQAIYNQASSINQQAALNICGDSEPDTCDFKGKFVQILDSLLVQINHGSSSASYPNTMPPVNILSPYLTGIQVTVVGQNQLQIMLQPCNKPFFIPYLQVGGTYFPPVSVCCQNNISCPNSQNCSFSLNVTYSNGQTNTLSFQTKCDFLKDCDKDTSNPCTKPSIYVKAVKEYLNGIFHFMLANNNQLPNQSQLMALLPQAIGNYCDKEAINVTLNPYGNFTISLFYKAPGSSSNPTKCDIILNNPGGMNWTNIKNLLSIAPDLSQAGNNNITTSFKLKALREISGNLSIIDLTGNFRCFPMNECPSDTTLCDTVRIWSFIPYHNDCVDELKATAYSNALNQYNEWIDSLKHELLEKYYSKCLAAIEQFNMQYEDRLYHFTLNYYDQAGNLVKTIPPAGVRLLNSDSIALTAQSRANGYDNPIKPKHIKRSVYRFNTLNQPVWQKTPDAGESIFLYDGLGRIVASQNAQQNTDGMYSYIRYDKLGRIFESGKVQAASITSSNTLNWNTWDSFISSQQNRTEITYTRYDIQYSNAVYQKFGNPGQRNLRNRVVSIFSYDTKANYSNGSYSHATHYTYDILGNVYTLIQDYPNGLIGDKKIEYKYDLQSGKVNEVIYQRGSPDQFFHKYSYDALNRLIKVKTSPDGLLWETDAEYFYYRHGPLARLELGTDKVQGLDYLYTLQGWIKGVNGTSLSPETDMGQDGIIKPPGQNSTQPQIIPHNGQNLLAYSAVQLYGAGFSGPGYGTLHNPVARDAYGYVLDYFTKDYKPIQGNDCLANLETEVGDVKHLYNGNISRMYTQLYKLGNMGFNYRYDQLHRIKSQQGWNLALSGNGVNMELLTNKEYTMAFSYDADGNINNLLRFGRASNLDMDNLTYHYYRLSDNDDYNITTGIPNDATNRLAYIEDKLPAGNYPESNPQNGTVTDIDNQERFNYLYDKIGNLTHDGEGKIKLITWNLQNKVNQIQKEDGTLINYGYDALGNRVMKAVTGNSAMNDSTFYVRDAQGNIVATYNKKEGKLIWSEQELYGSSRLGMFKPSMEIPASVTTTSIPDMTGNLTPQILTPVNFPNSDNSIQPAEIVVSRNDDLFGAIVYQHQVAEPKGLPQVQPKGAYFTATRGYKDYELTNHLGNVLATIRDRKLPLFNGTTLERYAPDISTSQDYYAFGMQMPGRKFSPAEYRFGFNGKENDKEVYGEGNFQDYGFRMYDTRIARFISVDPLTKKYPELTPFQFASNTPIMSIDLDGTEQESTTKKSSNDKKDETQSSSTTTKSQIKPLKDVSYETLNHPSENTKVVTNIKTLDEEKALAAAEYKEKLVKKWGEEIEELEKKINESATTVKADNRTNYEKQQSYKRADLIAQKEQIKKQIEMMAEYGDNASAESWLRLQEELEAAGDNKWVQFSAWFGFIMNTTAELDLKSKEKGAYKVKSLYSKGKLIYYGPKGGQKVVNSKGNLNYLKKSEKQ
jgi:RHS repeat-associated protein